MSRWRYLSIQSQTIVWITKVSSAYVHIVLIVTLSL